MRSPVRRTREGRMRERAGPTRRRKSRARWGWWTLKWRSDSCTAQTTGPSTSIILFDSSSPRPPAEVGIPDPTRTMRRNKPIRNTGRKIPIAQRASSRVVGGTGLSFSALPLTWKQPSSEGRETHRFLLPALPQLIAVSFLSFFFQ